MARVKRIRTAILPDMMASQLTPDERDRRWRDLAASYYVQQISHYPRDYILREKNLPERVVETVERLEEDFVDEARKYEPFHAVIEVGEAIPVGTQRDRESGGDPVMDRGASAVADDDRRAGGGANAGMRRRFMSWRQISAAANTCRRSFLVLTVTMLCLWH